MRMRTQGEVRVRRGEGKETRRGEDDEEEDTR